MNGDVQDTNSINRRRLLKVAGIGTVAAGGMWIAPSVLGSSTAFAAQSPNCNCGGATASAQLLTAQAVAQNGPLAKACSVRKTGTLATFCRATAGQKVYLWGTGTGASSGKGPLFDDIGVVKVTENVVGGATRYGNIYRFQSFCRQGTNIPTVLDPTYSAAVQRVYTGLDPNTWDYLPPQPAGGSAQTATPTTWWANSQPRPNNTESVGDPGWAVQTPWPGPIDISYLFGANCGSFTVTVEDRNRYQLDGWSNIFVGVTP